MIEKVNLLGYPISSGDLHENVEVAWTLIKDNTRGQYVACANPHSLVVADSDPVFSRSLKEADILLADGVGIVLTQRLLGQPGSERVAGFEFFMGLSARANEESDIKYFFLGSTMNVLDAIKTRLEREFPNIIIAGAYSPPFVEEFSDSDNEFMIKSINATKPHVLWVGMTAPKQEKWILKNRNRINVPLICSVGAVFDFYAGTKKRAPRWVCKLGLEWLPRLLREPRRLWRRNFISTPRFLIMVIKHHVLIKPSKGY